MREPETWEGLSAQETHLSTGIFFDFENSNGSRRACISTRAGSAHLTENVSYFLGPSLSRTQDNCPAALLAWT